MSPTPLFRTSAMRSHPHHGRNRRPDIPTLPRRAGNVSWRTDSRGTGRPVCMTLVLDASAIVELLIGSSRGEKVAVVMNRHDCDLHAPELITAESLSALRTLERRTALSQQRADEAANDLLAIPLSRYPTDVLLARVWSLRGRITIYDALYVV